MMDHVRYLADDALAGRGVATDGERCAADYIAKAFETLGLTPSGDGGSFFQSFDVRTGSEISSPGALTISSGAVRGNPWDLSAREWRPYGFSGSKNVKGALVYAGEGLARPGRDGAEALPTMEGRVVVVEARTLGVQSGDLYADPHFKGSVAQGRGAAALLLLDDEAPLPDPEREDRTFLRIPVVSVTGAAAARLREAARSGGLAVMSTETRPILSQARNVVALLPGWDPGRADEVVVVGAHYDHLGMGGASSLAPGQVAIHNGADDNASGTAALIEVARTLVEATTPARPVLFIAFSGEERGLLGSRHYVREPTVSLDDAVAMLNIDMVGRLRENQLTAFGVATAPGWKGILQAANASLDEPFTLTLAPDGYGPSDHSSFHRVGIPVLHFFTNRHSEYHRPEDDVETINGPGLKRVVDLVGIVTAELAGPGSSSTAAPQLSPAEAGPSSPWESGGRGPRPDPPAR